MEHMAESSEKRLVFKKEMLKLRGQELYDYYRAEVLLTKKTDL